MLATPCTPFTEMQLVLSLLNEIAAAGVIVSCTAPAWIFPSTGVTAWP